MNEATRYVVKYRLAGDDVDRVEGDEYDTFFDTRADALDHRNWFFGHSPGVVACWIENRDGKTTGAVLVRDDEED